jgi:putative ABC transport system substrate-binding protein
MVRPPPANAQTAMPVIGFLSAGTPNAPLVAAFRRRLSETGWVEGQNVAIEYRWAQGRYDRLPALAADLVGRKVDVIATLGGTPSALAAKTATSTIPIVFSSGDPDGQGLVASLARPGGNLTGFSIMDTELTPKRVELLYELVPQVTAMALLVNPDNATAERVMGTVQEAARVKGLQLQILKASTENEIDTVFATPSNCMPARSSSASTRSSSAGVSKSWRWRHAMPFRRSMGGASSPRRAA